MQESGRCKPAPPAAPPGLPRPKLESGSNRYELLSEPDFGTDEAEHESDEEEHVADEYETTAGTERPWEKDKKRRRHTNKWEKNTS